MTHRQTQLLSVDATRPFPPLIQHAAQILQQGGLVAFPTETVYGLGADALNATAVAHIFRAKKRPSFDPLIVHLADVAELSRVAGPLPPLAYTLAAHFWPGPLTLVLPKTAVVPDIVTAGQPTVAVRCPAHPVALALIRATGVPIAAPSANRFSHTSPTTAQHVWDDLAGEVDLILDGGATAVGLESTVLDLTGETPLILRPGGVTWEAVQQIVPTVQVRRQMMPPTTVPTGLMAPGLLERHYAPDTPLWLFVGTETAVRQAITETMHREMGNGRRLALLLADEDQPYFATTSATLITLGPTTDLAQVAHRLFDALRRLDAGDADLILARDFPPDGLGLAIHDRLRRAAQRVVGGLS